MIEFDAIDKGFKHSNIVLLNGIPGAGKTTLALEYAKWFSGKHSSSVVVWINAANQNKIDESYRTIIVKDLEMKESDYQAMTNSERTAKITKHIRQETTIKHLLIFDNIEKEHMETIKMILESLPAISNLKILLTSRDNDLDNKFEKQQFKMEDVTPDQVKLYFYDRMAAIQLSKPKG